MKFNMYESIANTEDIYETIKSIVNTEDIYETIVSMNSKYTLLGCEDCHSTLLLIEGIKQEGFGWHIFI